MRRLKSQKAIERSAAQLWNRMWQLGCPWIMGSELAPQPLRVSRHRKSSRLRSVTAICFMVASLVTPCINHANAQSGSDNVMVLASISPTMPNSYDYGNTRLFGAPEQKYSDITAFTKWNGAISKFKRDFKTSLNQKHVREWMGFLASLEDATPIQKIQAVNSYMNKRKFVSDIDNYGRRDYWATPMQFLQKGGDCEDYAFAKYVSLQALGFSANQMRLAVVYDHVMRMPHAVLIVYSEGKSEVLDNQNPVVMTSNEITRYKPIYSISEVAWWRH